MKQRKCPCIPLYLKEGEDPSRPVLSLVFLPGQLAPGDSVMAKNSYEAGGVGDVDQLESSFTK